MTNAEKIRLIDIACRAHRSAGGNFASLAYEVAIFDAGYAAALADAAELCMAVPLDHLNDGDEIAETYKACAFSCAARIRALGAK